VLIEETMGSLDRHLHEAPQDVQTLRDPGAKSGCNCLFPLLNAQHLGQDEDESDPGLSISTLEQACQIHPCFNNHTTQHSSTGQRIDQPDATSLLHFSPLETQRRASAKHTRRTDEAHRCSTTPGILTRTANQQLRQASGPPKELSMAALRAVAGPTDMPTKTTKTSAELQIQLPEAQHCRTRCSNNGKT
jgi:hypothetical protein